MNSAGSASSARRREMDIRKLMMSNYQVEMCDDGAEFLVDFHGPADTHYSGGVWKVLVTLPKDYPFRSPSIGFKSRLFHPNVDECSGSVCLDVINQTWSPMYELLNIFDVFLPQLLAYPNPSDPLNSSAASLMLHSPDKYEEKVKEYVLKYATLSAPNGEYPALPLNKTRHGSTDSTASSSTQESSGSARSMSTVSSSSSTVYNGAMQQDVDMDDLSSLSGESDNEDDLVLDL